jgi:AmiR/NasT family two-component response regulator
MKRRRNDHEARSVIGRAVERVADTHSSSRKAAREWLYREAMAKRASLTHVARAVIAEQTLHYQYPVPIQCDRTPR